MNHIILTEEERAQVDTDSIKGVENYSPSGTFRYNMDKIEHIESILGDVSDKIKDSSEIVMWLDNE